MRSSKRKYGNNKRVVDGVKFDSELEMYCYNMLKSFSVPFEFQKKITLIDGFKYNKETIRAVNIVVDFLINVNETEVYLDTKGYPTDVSILKYKMLKNYLKDKPNTEVVWLKTKKQVRDYIVNLKTENNVNNQQSNITW